MVIILENTSTIIQLNGMPARVWQGATNTGVQITALITGIAPDNAKDFAQCERELKICGHDTPVQVDNLFNKNQLL